ncbi:MAG: glycosyltransferase [Novosphingobium sp.]|nr:glycosyltransferase [Novosphingobium sp.]
MIAGTPRRTPQRIGVLVDDFALLAGATDFIVGFVDGLVRAAEGRDVVLVYRTAPPWWLWRGAARRTKALLTGKRAPHGPDWQGLHERLRQAGLPELPVLIVPRDETALVRLCRRERIDVIGPLTNPPFGRMPIPWLGYLFDFQHRHLPHFFTIDAITGRDRLFRRMLEKADAVVVNAADVRRDCGQYFPGLEERVLVLPFSAAPKAEWLEVDHEAARRKYGLGSRYFIVSNQFWLHKRHEVAIEAFARIAHEVADLELVMTGATDDPRSPTRLADIDALIDRLGIAGRVHILGLIPKLDQIAIMRSAVAVVQPTAFEGGPGGGSVFDAVALGVPSLVSSIPVNREIEEHVTRYFPLDDVVALAEAMRELIALPRSDVDPQVLISAGAARRRAMGQAIWQAAALAMDHARLTRRVRV